MRKKHLLTTSFSILALGVFSLASAETDLRSNYEVQKIQIDIQREELKSNYETQRAALEAQREMMKAEYETRKRVAEAKGDETQAKREAMKLELESKRAEMDAKRELKRVEAEARRASSTARRIEFQQDIAKRKVEKTTRVILATIERIDKIIIRLESRMAKVKTRGGDIVESERLVALAKTNLTEARAAVEAFTTIDLSSDKAVDNFERIRTAAAGARELIRRARENLMLSVRALHSIETDTDATSTIEVVQ